MRKSLSISGLEGCDMMDADGIVGGTEMLCRLFGLEFSAVAAGDTVLVTFDGPEKIVLATLKANIVTAAEFGLTAEEIDEN